MAEMRVTRKTHVGAYSREALTLLRGGDGKEPVRELRVSALGEAINAAVAVAARAERDGLGVITKVETAYPEMTGSGRSCAQIVISIKPAGPTFAFDTKPVGFSPLFLADAARATAAVNAGDYRLYVGGAAINRAFGELFKSAHGLKFVDEWTSKEYELLHTALLGASRAEGGAFVDAAEVPDARRQLGSLRLAASFGRSGQALSEDVPALEGSTGSVFIDVFEEGAQPLGPRSAAMLYAVGPKGEGCSGPRTRGSGQLLNRADFLASVERLGRSAMEAVAEYNRRQRSDPRGLPAIEEVRWCLVSGGVYRHGETGKVDVARATMRGMRSVPIDILVTFTYDEDAFRAAAEESVGP